MSEAALSPPQRELNMAIASVGQNVHTSKAGVEKTSKTLYTEMKSAKQRIKMVKLQMALY